MARFGSSNCSMVPAFTGHDMLLEHKLNVGIPSHTLSVSALLLNPTTAAAPAKSL